MENVSRVKELGSGRFGAVILGKFKDFNEEVAIKKMEKKKVQVDSSLYLKANGQLNIINYYLALNHRTTMSLCKLT